jgi:hypothetical protein
LELEIKQKFMSAGLSASTFLMKTVIQQNPRLKVCGDNCKFNAALDIYAAALDNNAPAFPVYVRKYPSCRVSYAK